MLFLFQRILWNSEDPYSTKYVYFHSFKLICVCPKALSTLFYFRSTAVTSLETKYKLHSVITYFSPIRKSPYILWLLTFRVCFEMTHVLIRHYKTNNGTLNLSLKVNWVCNLTNATNLDIWIRLQCPHLNSSGSVSQKLYDSVNARPITPSVWQWLAASPGLPLSIRRVQPLSSHPPPLKRPRR